MVNNLLDSSISKSDSRKKFKTKKSMKKKEWVKIAEKKFEIKKK